MIRPARHDTRSSSFSSLPGSLHSLTKELPPPPPPTASDSPPPNGVERFSEDSFRPLHPVGEIPPLVPAKDHLPPPPPLEGGDVRRRRTQSTASSTSEASVVPFSNSHQSASTTSAEADAGDLTEGRGKEMTAVMSLDANVSDDETPKPSRILDQDLERLRKGTLSDSGHDLYLVPSSIPLNDRELRRYAISESGHDGHPPISTYLSVPGPAPGGSKVHRYDIPNARSLDYLVNPRQTVSEFGHGHSAVKFAVQRPTPSPPTLPHPSTSKHSHSRDSSWSLVQPSSSGRSMENVQSTSPTPSFHLPTSRIIQSFIWGRPKRTLPPQDLSTGEEGERLSIRRRISRKLTKKNRPSQAVVKTSTRYGSEEDWLQASGGRVATPDFHPKPTIKVSPDKDKSVPATTGEMSRGVSPASRVPSPSPNPDSSPLLQSSPERIPDQELTRPSTPGRRASKLIRKSSRTPQSRPPAGDVYVVGKTPFTLVTTPDISPIGANFPSQPSIKPVVVPTYRPPHRPPPLPHSRSRSSDLSALQPVSEFLYHDPYPNSQHYRDGATIRSVSPSLAGSRQSSYVSLSVNNYSARTVPPSPQHRHSLPASPSGQSMAYGGENWGGWPRDTYYMAGTDGTGFPNHATPAPLPNPYSPTYQSEHEHPQYRSQSQLSLASRVSDFQPVGQFESASEARRRLESLHPDSEVLILTRPRGRPSDISTSSRPSLNLRHSSGVTIPSPVGSEPDTPDLELKTKKRTVRMPNKLRKRTSSAAKLPPQFPLDGSPIHLNFNEGRSTPAPGRRSSSNVIIPETKSSNGGATLTRNRKNSSSTSLTRKSLGGGIMGMRKGSELSMKKDEDIRPPVSTLVLSRPPIKSAASGTFE
ncbi:hypothetical protein BT69DRAFT_1280520 [Atractiella rhizophila]|nr:hypothetical protein BT69DRAFT_1280520 [Atractiella rhizophila]